VGSLRTNVKRRHLGEDAFDPDSDGDHDRDTKESRAGSRRSTFKTSWHALRYLAKQDGPSRHDPVGAAGSASSNSSLRPAKHIGNLEHAIVQCPLGRCWTTRDFGEFSATPSSSAISRSGWIAAFQRLHPQNSSAGEEPRMTLS